MNLWSCNQNPKLFRRLRGVAFGSRSNEVCARTREGRDHGLVGRLSKNMHSALNPNHLVVFFIEDCLPSQALHFFKFELCKRNILTASMTDREKVRWYLSLFVYMMDPASKDCHFISDVSRLRVTTYFKKSMLITLFQLVVYNGIYAADDMVQILDK